MAGAPRSAQTGVQRARRLIINNDGRFVVRFGRIAVRARVRADLSRARRGVQRSLANAQTAARVRARLVRGHSRAVSRHGGETMEDVVDASVASGSFALAEEAVADAVVDAVVDAGDAAGGGHWITGDTWLLNLTSLAEGLQGVNLTEGVNLQGWVLNITALVEDIPLAEFVPVLSLREWFQWLFTLLALAFSTQWVIVRIQKYMCVCALCSRRATRGLGNSTAARDSIRSNRPTIRNLSLFDVSVFRRARSDPLLPSPLPSPSPGARNADGTTPSSSRSTRV